MKKIFTLGLLLSSLVGNIVLAAPTYDNLNGSRGPSFGLYNLPVNRDYVRQMDMPELKVQGDNLILDPYTVELYPIAVRMNTLNDDMLLSEVAGVSLKFKIVQLAQQYIDEENSFRKKALKDKIAPVVRNKLQKLASYKYFVVTSRFRFGGFFTYDSKLKGIDLGTSFCPQIRPYLPPHLDITERANSQWFRGMQDTYSNERITKCVIPTASEQQASAIEDAIHQSGVGVVETVIYHIIDTGPNHVIGAQPIVSVRNYTDAKTGKILATQNIMWYKLNP